MTKHYSTALVWLRRDLRLEDQAPLSRALIEAEAVVPVFLFDQAILAPLPRADRRVEFIWETLAALKAELNRLGSDLIVRHGRAATEIPRLAEELGAQAVYCSRDYEPAAIARDVEVEAAPRRAPRRADRRQGPGGVRARRGRHGRRRALPSVHALQDRLAEEALPVEPRATSGAVARLGLRQAAD